MRVDLEHTLIYQVEKLADGSIVHHCGPGFSQLRTTAASIRCKEKPDFCKISKDFYAEVLSQKTYSLMRRFLMATRAPSI
jgi:hypothetical protein